jgi:hypothetical protein
MNRRNEREDEPLPATGRFVAFLGAFLVLAWFLAYALLRARW